MNYGGLRNDHFETPAQINQRFCSFFVRSALGLPLRTDWLSESAGSQLSPAAYEKSWRALEYKAALSSIGANFLQLSP